ncbi:MAG TPA: GntR family transcriptional regulator [Candidatus Acidoferrum sp.]|jgi:GntR family transcriptional regulator
MPAKAHSVPAYQRILSAIRKRIDAGQLRPGDPVTSERDLAKLHEVSLMTARHALTTLEREGIVERRRGVGTFVSAPRIHFNKLQSYTEQMAARNLTAASRILYAKLIDNEPDAANRLSLPPAEQLTKIERVRHASGEPFALETCYVCAAEFPGLLAAPLQHNSLFAILERDYGAQLGYADEEIDATAADPRIAELLNVPRREPLLRIRQIGYSTKEKPLVYTLGIYRSDRHNFVIRRFR